MILQRRWLRTLLTTTLLVVLAVSAQAEEDDAARKAFLERAGKLGVAVAADLNRGKLDGFLAAFDQSHYIDRSTGDLLLNTADVADLKRTLTAETLWAVVLKAAREGVGAIHYVGMRRRGDHDVALYRFQMKPSTLLWFGVLIVADDEGALRMVDLFDYAAGAWNTADILHRLEAAVPEANPEPDPLLVKHGQAYLQAVLHFVAGRFPLGDAIYRELPPELRRREGIMRWRVNAAAQSSAARYKAAVDAFRKAHPDSEFLIPREKDFALAAKRWPDFLEGVDALDRLLGGDPYLGGERAVAYMHLEQYRKAADALDKAIEGSGDLQELLAMRFMAALHQKHFAKAAAMGRRWEAATGQEIAFGPHMPNLEAFRASAPFAAWRKALPAAPTPAAHASHEALVRAVDADFRAGKVDAYVQAIDMDALADHALQGLALDDATRARVHRSVSSSNGLRTTIAQLMRAGILEGGRFRFIRIKTVRKRPAAIFRLAGHGLMSWWGFHLGSDTDGQSRIEDVLNFGNGGWFSDHIRRMVLFQHPKAAGEEQATFEAFKKTYDKMQDAFGNLRYEEGLRYYEKLPASWRVKRNVLEARLHAARHAGDDAYATALAAIVEHHPGDEGAMIKQFELGMVREHYEEARRAVDRLDKALGGDPYLDLKRAEILVRTGKEPQAQALTSAFMKKDRSLADAYIVLAECAVARGEFQEAVRHYGRAAAMRTNPFEPSKQVPRATDFFASKPYKRWQARKLLEDD